MRDSIIDQSDTPVYIKQQGRATLKTTLRHVIRLLHWPLSCTKNMLKFAFSLSNNFLTTNAKNIIKSDLNSWNTALFDVIKIGMIFQLSKMSLDLECLNNNNN